MLIVRQLRQDDSKCGLRIMLLVDVIKYPTKSSLRKKSLFQPMVSEKVV